MHGLLTSHDRIAGSPAAPILTALESYRGQFIDLEQNRAIGGAELLAGANAVAHWLAELGLAAGDRVVFSVGNGPVFPAALCGTLSAGASPIVLHGDTPTQERRRVAQQYSARFVVSQCSLGAQTNSGTLPDWLNLHCTEIPLDPQGPTFPPLAGATLHPTSGTTGQAKIAVRTALQSIEEARHYIETMQILAEDRILCVVPMSHAYGFGMGFMVPLLCGASVVTPRQFNPRTIGRVISDQQITVLPVVPAMLDLILLAGTEGVVMPRLVLAAGAPLTEGTAIAFRKQTGTPVTALYGTTETGGITVAVGEVDILPGGCVGRPMRGVEARVAPIADAAELPPDVGRVAIRSSSMMSGYLTPTGVDGSAIRDGWFETGDLGRVDKKGRIQLVGREKEVINVFGMKVIPSEVEEVIAALPGVREVKVYAGKHRSGSDLVKAAVAVEAGVDAAEIRGQCEANLPPYKRPQLVILVEALPRTPTGKIMPENLP